MRTCFLFFLILSCHSLLHAQQKKDTVILEGQWLTAKEGLSQGMVSSILQDKEGYIWFATKDGLNKYDGYNITVYRHNPDDPFSLPDNYVTKIAEDTNGNFWVSTLLSGMYLFEKKKERFYPAFSKEDKKKPAKNIVVNFFIRRSRLLIQSADDITVYDIEQLHPGGYENKLNEKVIQVLSYNNLQPDKKYKYAPGNKIVYSWPDDESLLIRGADTLFRCTEMLKEANWVLQGYSPSIAGIPKNELPNCILDAYPQSPGKLFYLYKNNLYQLDIDALKYERIITVSTNPSTACLKFQSLPDGTMYIYMQNALPLIYNPANNSLTSIALKKGGEIFSAVQSDICYDASGIMWCGTAGFGVFKTDTQKPPFRKYKTDDNTEAFTLLYGKSWEQYAEKIRQKIYAGFHNFIRGKNGNFWFVNFFEKEGMKGELVLLDPQKNTFTKYNFFHPEIYGNTSIFKDRQERIWIFSDEGLNKKMLYRFNEKEGVADITASFPIEPAESNQYPFVSAWWQDEKNVFWLATVQGLFMYDPAGNWWKHWQNIPGNTASLPMNMLFTVCADPKEPLKYLWAGTNGAGFFRFDINSGKCIRYSDKDGLPNNVVYGILSDSTGNLWMSTNKGISCFNPAKKTFRNFTREDNLPCDEFNRSQYLMLPGGNMMFGGVEGYTVFNPRDVLQVKPAVPVVFTGLSISNKPVDWKQQSSVISSPAGYAKKILLHPGQNMFTISFASLEYRSNEKKLYKYRLDGFDKDWTNPSAKNEATYTNLSPGTYILHVTGANTDGVWNAEGISMKVTVLPYWYQTWLFKIIVALLIAGGIYALYKYRLNQKLHLLEIRNRIAGDLHDEIGSTLSSISLSSTIIQQKLENENNEVQHLLGQISNNTDSMMEAMSDIVWAINTRNDSFESLINRMRAFAIEMLEPQGVEVQFNVNDTVLHHNLDMVQRKNIYLLFKEAINNAAKYAACKNVWVNIRQHGRKIMMRIKDDGKGFMYDKVKETAGENNLGGNGLPGMRKRAADMKGHLIIDSASGKGTEIVVEFVV